MSDADSDARWMTAALALSARGLGRTAQNPSVGCIIVAHGSGGAGGEAGQARVVGRGWTQPGGRPHAEAMAVAAAGDRARGTTAYVTLEPCAHASMRGPACADVLIAAGVTRVVAALRDPFAAVDGKGFDRLRAAGIAVTVGPGAAEATRAMAGFLMRQRSGRPHVTLKLATSIDGCIAMTSGASRWITGDAARRHAHVVRAQSDAIVVGRATVDADAPTLDVRLAGLEDRAPQRLMLTHGTAPAGWTALASPAAIASLDPAITSLLVEGGAGAAAAFLRADLVDMLLLYRAPIIIGGGRAAIGDIGLGALDEAHGRWRLIDTRRLGPDSVDRYERLRED